MAIWNSLSNMSTWLNNVAYPCKYILLRLFLNLHLHRAGYTNSEVLFLSQHVKENLQHDTVNFCVMDLILVLSVSN